MSTMQFQSSSLAKEAELQHQLPANSIAKKNNDMKNYDDILAPVTQHSKPTWATILKPNKCCSSAWEFKAKQPCLYYLKPDDHKAPVSHWSLKKSRLMTQSSKHLFQKVIALEEGYPTCYPQAPWHTYQHFLWFSTEREPKPNGSGSNYLFGGERRKSGRQGLQPNLLCNGNSVLILAQHLLLSFPSSCQSAAQGSRGLFTYWFGMFYAIFSESCSSQLILKHTHTTTTWSHWT